MTELNEIQTVKPVLSLVVTQVSIDKEQKELKVSDKWIYPACDYAFCGPVEANGVKAIYQEGQSIFYCL